MLAATYNICKRFGLRTLALKFNGVPKYDVLNPFPCYRRLLSSAYNVSKLVATLTVFPKECFYHINFEKRQQRTTKV